MNEEMRKKLAKINATKAEVRQLIADGKLSETEVYCGERERRSEYRDLVFGFFVDEILEVVDGGSVANGVENESGYAGAEQNPPGAVSGQVHEVVADVVLDIVNRSDSLAGEQEAAEEEERANDGEAGDGLGPSGLLFFDVRAFDLPNRRQRVTQL